MPRRVEDATGVRADAGESHFPSTPYSPRALNIAFALMVTDLDVSALWENVCLPSSASSRATGAIVFLLWRGRFVSCFPRAAPTIRSQRHNEARRRRKPMESRGSRECKASSIADGRPLTVMH